MLLSWGSSSTAGGLRSSRSTSGIDREGRPAPRCGRKRGAASRSRRSVRSCRVSALQGDGLAELMRRVDACHRSAFAKLAASRLTRELESAVEHTPPPLVRGRRIKLRYAHQGGSNPPVIVVHGSRTELIPASYRRYLAGRFRAAFALVGTPLRIEFRAGENPFKGRRNPLTPRQRRRRERRDAPRRETRPVASRPDADTVRLPKLFVEDGEDPGGDRGHVACAVLVQHDDPGGIRRVSRHTDEVGAAVLLRLGVPPELQPREPSLVLVLRGVLGAVMPRTKNSPRERSRSSTTNPVRSRARPTRRHAGEKPPSRSSAIAPPSSRTRRASGAAGAPAATIASARSSSTPRKSISRESISASSPGVAGKGLPDPLRDSVLLHARAFVTEHRLLGATMRDVDIGGVGLCPALDSGPVPIAERHPVERVR